LKLSPKALNYVRDFVEGTTGFGDRDWVASIDWCTSATIKRGPDRPVENIGPGLSLGAYERRQIPAGYTQVVEGIEFALKIPSAIWSQSVERLIDLDESLLFKLVLR
jgi:hypothetical protein